MDTRKFDRDFSIVRGLVLTIFVAVVVLTIGYYVLLGFAAVKAIDALETECKGSIAYCLGKATKQFQEGAND